MLPDSRFIMIEDSKPTILCVDDVSDNLLLLGQELEDEGYHVQAATDGVQALAMIEKRRPDAVLLDWQMPKMSGIEVLVALRKNYDPLTLPVIMVTAQRTSEGIVKCFRCGANDYVEKPIEFSVLLARLGAHLRLCRLTVEQQGLTRQLQELSRTDPLTKIDNRRAFDELGQASFSFARRHGSAMSVVIFDADHFKSINDSFGHRGGDMALRAIAEMLERSRRKEDGLARIGGEEFALICPNASAQEASVVAKRCCEEIRGLSILGLAPARYVTLSAGVAQLSDEHASFADLVHEADRAMYRAKQRGRDGVFTSGDDPALLANA